MDDRLLTIDEAAAMLNTSKDWLYRNWKKLPFVVQLSARQIRFSLKGIEKWIEEKQHAGTRVQAGESVLD
jgi:predicted DNA-binding transcriptional regulator AlpA